MSMCLFPRIELLKLRFLKPARSKVPHVSPRVSRTKLTKSGKIAVVSQGLSDRALLILVALGLLTCSQLK